MSQFKKAKNSEEAWNIQDTMAGKPHGWIQWKGTNVCMDVHCECGYHSHIDADFAYNVECPKCGAVYMCNGHIELIRLEERPTMVAKDMADIDEDSYSYMNAPTEA